MSNPSSQQPDNPYIFNLMATFGAEVIGAAISTAFWGISCMQVSLYFLNYASRDRRPTHVFVIYLWALATVIEVLTWTSVFPGLITHWGSVQLLNEVSADIVHRTWLSYIMSFSSQMFFLNRIYRFTGGGIITAMSMGVVIILALWQLVGVFIFTYWIITVHQPLSISLSLPRLRAVQLSIRCTSAVIDIVITIWMTTILFKKARATSFRGVTRLVYRLMWMSINNGTWTALLALIDFALIAGEASSNLAFTLLEYPLSALYLNVVLANLNARMFLRSPESSGLPVVYDSNSADLGQRAVRMIPLRPISRGTSGEAAHDAVKVQIDRDVTLRSDMDSMAGQKAATLS